MRSPKWLANLAGTPEAIENTAGKTSLLKQFDTIRRDIDQSGIMDTMDKFQQQALDLVLGSEARDAFDIDREDPKTADRYGQSPWGRYTLMARRLVEAGVTFVTVDMPHWDDHSSIEKAHGAKVPVVDQAVSALIDDLDDRGLLDRVMVVVMGEFGRTPRINTGQPGIPVPGRDHWGNAISVLIAGGGLTPGVVVGRTNAKAEHPVERALKPAALLATIYHQLGIDANSDVQGPHRPSAPDTRRPDADQGTGVMPTAQEETSQEINDNEGRGQANRAEEGGRQEASTRAKNSPVPEKKFLAAIKKATGDLTAHLAYADWLAEQNQGSRAAALRAWAEFIRIPVTEVGMKGVVAAYHNYRDSLKLKDAEWIDALEKIRPWIPTSLAEKIVRVCLDDARGAAEAATWTVDVSPCFLDDRWSGGYRGELEADGKKTRQSGAFFIDQITGNCSDDTSAAREIATSLLPAGYANRQACPSTNPVPASKTIPPARSCPERRYARNSSGDAKLRHGQWTHET